MNNFLKTIENIAGTDLNRSKQDFELVRHFPWHERCHILASALEKTNSHAAASLIARKLIQEFAERYVGIIKAKLANPTFKDHRADLIRSLKGFDCSSIVFELIDVLICDNYEQAYAAYVVLANADFELPDGSKSIVKKKLSEISRLAFCSNKKQLKLAIEDISENIQLA